jgi:hypothetical protein
MSFITSLLIVLGICFLFLLPQIIKLVITEIKLWKIRKEILDICDRICDKNIYGEY